MIRNEDKFFISPAHLRFHSVVDLHSFREAERKSRETRIKEAERFSPDDNLI